MMINNTKKINRNQKVDAYDCIVVCSALVSLYTGNLIPVLFAVLVVALIEWGENTQDSIVAYYRKEGVQSQAGSEDVKCDKVVYEYIGESGGNKYYKNTKEQQDFRMLKSKLLPYMAQTKKNKHTGMYINGVCLFTKEEVEECSAVYHAYICADKGIVRKAIRKILNTFEKKEG